jgi:hypothetical protein
LSDKQPPNNAFHLTDGLAFARPSLSPDELAKCRAWFLEYDWAAWDRQLDRDVKNGRLDDLGEKALRDHAAGKTSQL